MKTLEASCKLFSHTTNLRGKHLGKEKRKQCCLTYVVTSFFLVKHLCSNLGLGNYAILINVIMRWCKQRSH